MRKIVSFAAKASPHISNYRELFLIPFIYVLVLQKKVQIAHFYQRDRRAEFDTFFLRFTISDVCDDEAARKTF